MQCTHRNSNTKNNNRKIEVPYDINSTGFIYTYKASHKKDGRLYKRFVLITVLI